MILGETKRIRRIFFAWIMIGCMFFVSMPVMAADGNELNIQSHAVVLMESSTGEIVYEKNATERVSPASITKIMTLLLTFETIAKGDAALDDRVIVSEYASSMGGSQVYLAQGEEQTLETMIKCIVVSSGNDASVAVAEHIAGSEEAFVQRMNEKASQLGMTDTHFEDCCGLTDSDNHYTTAKDVAVMSRELTYKYPDILKYSGIWMEDIVHETKQGRSVFGLSSTNKLLKQYPYATGLKTGFTSKAKYCLSASASKDGIDLIAVIMAAPDSKTRFSEAQVILNYGFSKVRLYKDENKDVLPPVKVEQGKQEHASVRYEDSFRYLDTEGKDLSGITKEVKLPESVCAPVKAGEAAGVAEYYLDGKLLGAVSVLYGENVEEAGYGDCFKVILQLFLLQ